MKSSSIEDSPSAARPRRPLGRSGSRRKANEALCRARELSSKETAMPFTLEIESRQLSERAADPLELRENTLTVRELIESRVRQQLPDRNGIEVRRALKDALAAFHRSTYLVILDDRRLEDLDEEVTLTPIARLTFWRLLPLAGG